MGTRFILFQLILISSFGLISCGSDDSSGQSDSPQEYNVEVRNMDETIQRIQKTSSLEATSAIALEVEDQAFTADRVLTQTRCVTNFLSQEVTYENEMESTSMISIQRILPPEVFTPNPNTASFVSCDLDIEVHRGGHSPIQIHLTEVQITALEEVSSREIPFLRADQPPYFLLQDLATQRLHLRAENRTVQTLCEAGQSVWRSQGQEVSLAHLLPPSLFAIQNLQTCRFYWKDNDQVQLSPVFWVQHRTSQIRYSVQPHFRGEPRLQMQGKPLFTIEITNEGEADAIYQLIQPLPQLIFLPIYLGTFGSWQSTGSYKINGQWRVVNPPNPIATLPNQQKAYKLSPGQSLTLELVARDNYRCGIGIQAQLHLGALGIPQQSIFLQGYQYRLHSFPSIKVAPVNRLDAKGWSHIQPVPSRSLKKGDQYFFWAPNPELPDLGGVPSSAPPSVTTEFGSSFVDYPTNQFKCRKE